MTRADYSIDIDDEPDTTYEDERELEDEPDTTYEDERALDDEYRRDCIRGIRSGG